MFPLFDRSKGRLIVLGRDTQIVVRKSDATENEIEGAARRHVVFCVRESAVLFGGTPLECDAFLDELFLAMMHMKGAEVGELIGRAKRALEESE